MAAIVSTRTTYRTGDESYENFILPEYRALTYKFSDPLSLCFKLMIDWDKPSGLLADESNVNSALAYLNRIGEKNRYDLLKKWIEVFYALVKNYDFLLMDIEGLDVIMNNKPNYLFTGNEEEKITFNYRETKDMLVQSLITMYRTIWFDDERCVEVLPGNLRKFDVSVLVYSAGYYNMVLYDVLERNNLTYEDVDVVVLPTIKKLSENYFFEKNPDGFGFNNILVNLGSAEILTHESGKNFFSRVSNESSDEMVMNNISLTFKTASYIGTFSNLFGNFNITDLLATAAAQDRLNNEELSEVLYEDMVIKNRKLTYKDTIKNVKNNVKNYTSGLKSSLNSAINDEVKKAKETPAKYLNTLLSPLSPIGGAFNKLSDPAYLVNMAKNTADLGLQKIGDFANSQITKLNNLVIKNFSDNFVDAYKNYFGKDEVKNKPDLLVNNKKTESGNGVFYTPQSIQDTEKGIKYSPNENIYNRRNF